MLLVAFAAASFAWWWNYQRGQRALALFGAEAAHLIRTAPRVEFLRPPPEGPLELSRAPGILNARTSLLSDASYEWNEPPPSLESPRCTVRFTSGERSVEVTFDFENSVLQASSTARIVKLKRKTADGWQTYLARQQSQDEGRGN